MAGASWRRTLAVLTALTALVGCGSSSTTVTKTVTSSVSAATTPASTTSSSAPDAASGRLRGQDGGFSTVVPLGWQDAAALLRHSQIRIQYAVSGPATAGLLTNINVVREPSSGSDVVALARASIKGLRAAFPALGRMSSLRALTVGESPARSFNYFTRNSSGQHVHVQQIVVAHAGYAYTITYSVLASRYAKSLSALNEVVRGWRWQ